MNTSKKVSILAMTLVFAMFSKAHATNSTTAYTCEKDIKNDISYHAGQMFETDNEMTMVETHASFYKDCATEEKDRDKNCGMAAYQTIVLGVVGHAVPIVPLAYLAGTAYLDGKYKKKAYKKLETEFRMLIAINEAATGMEASDTGSVLRSFVPNFKGTDEELISVVKNYKDEDSLCAEYGIPDQLSFTLTDEGFEVLRTFEASMWDLITSKGIFENPEDRKEFMDHYAVYQDVTYYNRSITPKKFRYWIRTRLNRQRAQAKK